MSQQPIKSVYRSASISLRKAELAKDGGDTDERLFQLQSFVTTVRHTLRTHPMYPRRKEAGPTFSTLSTLRLNLCMPVACGFVGTMSRVASVAKRISQAELKSGGLV